MIPQEVIEEIRKNADIVSVISSYIQVFKKGNSYMAVCPFHADKNPSMHISREKQLYKCFSCGEGGNVFSFVQEYEKCSFIDAVIKVADIIGYASPLLSKPERVVDENTKKVLGCLKEVNDIYKYALNSKDGAKAKEYFLSRNIGDDMIDYFQLGYSSSNSEMTIKMLGNIGYDIETIDNAGILLRQRNLYLDRFNGRVMFPIFNEYSEVIGFSGRIMEKGASDAKYMNSPNTIVFNKSNVLYNYQNAKKEAKKEGYVYIVEGFMDVFALYKAGIKSSVALMGTAFTSQHAKMLKKLGVELRLCLDGDEAGQHGILKMIEILDGEGIHYSIVNYKDCLLDPDEILQKYGPSTLNKFLGRIFDKFEFLIAYFKKKCPLDTFENKKIFLNELLPYISKISNKLDREIMIKRISSLTDISVESISSSIYKNLTTSDLNFSPEITVRKQKEVISRLTRCEKNAMYLILNYPEAKIEFEKNSEACFLDKVLDTLYRYLCDYAMYNPSYSIPDFISYISMQNELEPIYKERVSEISDDDNLKNIYKNYDASFITDLINVHANELKKNNRKKQIDRIALNENLSSLEKAEKINDISKINIEAKKGA